MWNQKSKLSRLEQSVSSARRTTVAAVAAEYFSSCDIFIFVAITQRQQQQINEDIPRDNVCECEYARGGNIRVSAANFDEFSLPERKEK